ncbi:MAG: hypothetical protein MZV49_24175 [Rhodopseudomonas palustris]|nr:hypothetical protein [Rhodopseudomonas palustris]
MMMFSKKATEAKAAALLLADDISRLRSDIKDLTYQQKETNKILRELVDVNKDFTHVIENFFALRKKLDIEEARRREKRELDLEPSKFDEKY